MLKFISMKTLNLFFFLTGIWLTAAAKPSSRLFVPSFPTVIDVFEDDIFLPAYNIDLIRAWPADLHPLEHIIAGNASTKLILKHKGTLLTLTVQQALLKKYITLYSITKAVNGRNEGLIMEPLPDVKLVSLSTKGLVASDTTDDGHSLPMDSLNKNTNHDYSLNLMYATTWSDNQQKVWHVMTEPLITRLAALDSLQRAIFDNIVTGSHNLPPYYVCSYEKGIIHIHAKKEGFNLNKSEPNFYNDGGMPFLMLGDLAGQLKVLISEDPQPGAQGKIFFNASGTGLDSIIVSGKYRGIVPLKIHFTTDQKVELIAKFDDSQIVLGPDKPYPVKLFLAYDLSDKSEECRIMPPRIMDFPSGKNESALKACGLTVEAEEGGFSLGL